MANHPQDNNSAGSSTMLLQDALVAIGENRLGVAHRLLLQANRNDPDNVQVLLLLSWTAPSSASAAFFFHWLLEQHPENPLARDIMLEISHTIANEEIHLGFNTHEAKKEIPVATVKPREDAVQIQTEGNQTTLVDKHLAARKAAIADEHRTDKKIIPENKHIPDGKIIGSAPIRMDKQVITVKESHATNIKNKRVEMLTNIRIPLIYLGALTLAEALTTLSIPQIGLLLHGLLLVMLILHATLFARRGLQKFLITLTLAPLIRLMSLSLPLLDFPFIYWYALIGVPLVLAAFLVLRTTGFKATRIGLNMRKLPWQLVVGLTGLGLGFMEYLILHPTPLVETLTWRQILLPSLILLIFTGFLEELIFRGLIQRGAAGTVGHYGLLYVAILFTVLHLGYRSVWDLVFVFVVALFFGLVVTRTGSLLGVTLSHGLTNITLYLIIPFLMNASANPVATKSQLPTEATAIPVVWLMPDINTTIINMIDEGDFRVTQVNRQLMLFDTNANTKPDWVFIEEKGKETNQKWQPKHLEYRTRREEDSPPVKSSDSKLVRSPISYSMMVIE